MKYKVSIFLYSEISEDKKNVFRRNNNMLSFMQFLYNQRIAWCLLPSMEFARYFKVFLVARMIEIS